jgi:hypothetical protein
MTADQFTAPAAPAEQAKALLADAAHAERFYSPYLDDSHRVLQKLDAGTAQYAAQAATAHAMLAVAEELAGLRAELRQAVGAPREDLFQLASAVRGLAAAVATSAAQDADTAAAVRDLAATLDQGVEFADTAAAATDSIATSMHDLLDVIDRPRWWQWRRRRQMRNLAKNLPLGHLGEVYEFRLELLRPLEADETSERGPLACTTFNATYGTAVNVAHLLLPSLCDEAGVNADPEQVYGRIAGRDRGGEYLFHALVLLPGATVIDAPEGGF